MKANSDKSHLLLSCNETFTPSSSIETNTKEVLLEITIDKDLKFDDHINSPCKKACLMLLLTLHHTWMLKKKDNDESTQFG